MFCFVNREKKYLKKLRDTQSTLSYKRGLVNELRCPTYHELPPVDIENFARYFLCLTQGMMSPQEFASRCIDRARDEDKLFQYLKTLGEYFIVLSDYELKSIEILKEIKLLEEKERALKRLLDIK